MHKRFNDFRFVGQPLSVVLPFTLILVGLVSVILLLMQRDRWDEHYLDVIACLDYNAAVQLSQVSGQTLESTLTSLRAIGYSSVAVSEMTVLTASDKGYLFEVSDDVILEWASTNKALAELMPDILVRRNFCINGLEREQAARERLELAYNDNVVSAPISSAKMPSVGVASAAISALPVELDSQNGTELEAIPSDSSKAVENPNGWYLISIPREQEVDFNKVALGFDPAEWRVARNAGFDVVPRLVNNAKYDAADIKALFANLDEVSKITFMPHAPSDYRTILFEGDAVPGFPFNHATTAQEIKKRDLFFGWIEFEIQEGAGGLAALVSPNVAITHSISAEEMVKQTSPVAKSRFIRALKERNVRLIYIRPFFTSLFEDNKIHQAVDVDVFNLDYLETLHSNIAKNRFHIAREPSQPVFEELHLLKLFVVFGVIGMTALTLRFVVQTSKWIEPTFWVVSVLCSIGLFAVSQNTLYTFWALVAAIVAPLLGSVIAIAFVARAKASIPTKYLSVLCAYFTAVIITSLGGMAVYSLINSANAFVKTEAFRGVMLSLAVPVLFIAVYAWDIQSFVIQANSRIPGWIARFNALLDRKIEFVDMLIVFLGLAAIALILLRSGNEAPIGVAQMELIFRERLEDLLSVRPRTKEIIGLPALFFFLAYFYRRKPPSIVLLLLGSVALTSIVNTFCHLHTPIAISVVRTLIGALIGLIAGSIIYLAYQLYLTILTSVKKKETAS